jgi:K+-sensing histidine kinase KdpD
MVILWIGAAAVVPTLIRLALDHVTSDLTIFPAYFPFILAATNLLGWRSGVVVAILSAFAANYMFLGPRFAFSAALPDIVSTLIFLVSAGAVIFGVERLKSARAAELAAGLSYPAGTASHPLTRGTGILLAASLALASWAAVIWGAVRLFR